MYLGLKNTCIYRFLLFFLNLRITVTLNKDRNKVTVTKQDNSGTVGTGDGETEGAKSEFEADFPAT